MAKSATAWSASRAADFKECEKMFEYKHVLRVKHAIPPSLQRIFDRGTRVHKIGEWALRGELDDLQDAVGRTVERAGKVTQGDVDAWWPWVDHLFELRDDGAIPERKWALSEDLRVVDFTDWKRAWVRAITDAHVMGKSKTLYVEDFKTGRIYRDKHEEQAEIYAWVGSIVYPESEGVEVTFWYIDKGPQSLALGQYDFTRRDLEEIAEKWLETGRRITTTTKFKANPGPACKRCPFSKFKKMPDGARGPCQHAVED